MKLRLRFSEIWPTLLTTVSLSFIAIYFLNIFFPAIFKSKQNHPGINITCFAYRDVNRNGVYDVEDRPYAGLNVALDRPKGGSVRRESNISGFANFKMSLGDKKSDIFSPGEHTIRVEAPRDWEVTSSNSVQSLITKERAGTAGGMFAVRTFDSVGVAPRLSISGSIRRENPELHFSNAVFRAKSPSGSQLAVDVSKTGGYSFPATSGDWKLEFATTNGESISRELSVNAYPVLISQIGFDSKPVPAKPFLRVVAFDNLTPSDTLYEIPNGYEGLDWRNWVATHQKLYQGNGYINANVSSEYVAYMSSGHPATISSKKRFDFVGAYFGAAWPQTEEHDVIIKAWRGDLQVYEDRFRASTSGPIYFDADYRDINRIDVSSDGYWQVVMDDFVYRF